MRAPRCAAGETGASDGTRSDRVPEHRGEIRMTAMDLVGLLLIVALVAPLVTARPSRY
jgi:hypothetical protein